MHAGTQMTWSWKMPSTQQFLPWRKGKFLFIPAKPHSYYVLSYTSFFEALIPWFDVTGLKVKYRGKILRLVSLMRSVFSSMLLCWSSYCTFCWVLWLCAWIFTTSRVKNACHSTEFFSEGYGALVLIPIVLFAEFWHQLKWRTTSLKSSKFARLFLPINCSDVKWMYFFALCKEDGKSNFFAITVAHNTRTVSCMCEESCWPQRGKENILKLLVTFVIKSSHK